MWVGSGYLCSVTAAKVLPEQGDIMADRSFLVCMQNQKGVIKYNLQGEGGLDRIELIS